MLIIGIVEPLSWVFSFETKSYFPSVLVIVKEFFVDLGERYMVSFFHLISVFSCCVFYFSCPFQINLNDPHKPKRRDEEERILAANGWLILDSLVIYIC